MHSYDNERSLALKTGWALQQGYRGVFFWEIKQDRLEDGSNPLLEASRKALDQKQSNSDAPYPPSKFITKLTWSPDITRMKGYANGDTLEIARGGALAFEPEAGVSGTFSIVAVDPQE